MSQNGRPYQVPPLTGYFSPDPLSETPKEYRFDNSETPPVTGDVPTFPAELTTVLVSPRDAHHLENKRKRQSAASRPNPHRRFSKKWVAFAWDTAVEVGKWPRIAYLLVVLIFIGGWTGIMLNFANEEVKYEKSNLAGSQDRGNNPRFPNEIVVMGALREFDSVERSLTISWSLVYVDTDNVTFLDFGNTPDYTVHLNIYRDVKAVPEDRTSRTLNVTGQYRIDNITEVPIAVLGAHPWDSVTTEIDFGQAISSDPWTQPLFGFPFDRWTGSIVFAATDRDFAVLAGLDNTWIISLDDAVLTDSTFNWRITSSNINNTCQNPDPAAGCELHIDFEGRRPGLVIFATMVALVVNWTTTLGIFLITCEAVVMRRAYILKETDILAACLTALFALPSIRAILPGSPDFGAIDLIGIIPNIIIISLCTTTIAVSKLRMHRCTLEKDE